MVRIEHITAAADIERLSTEWKALWQRVPNATPFQSPEWLISWWECFGNSTRVVLTARDGRDLVAVLPVYRLEERGFCKLLPIGISLSDYLDAVVCPNYPGLAETLLAALVDLPGWHECYIPDLPPLAAMLAAQCPRELEEEVGAGETCPILALPDAVEALSTVIPRKTLRDLRQARRRAAAVGTAGAMRATAATLTEFMEEFFRLHESRWRPIVGHGVCADPVVREFHLAAAGRMIEAGMLRLYLLRIGTAAIAAYYGFLAKGIAFAYLSAFDPERADLSPGTQIVGHAIEEAVREGACEFHFLRGGEAYKYAWGAVDRWNTTRILRRKC
jgi:CelD/BcsL family acetyltransferase involved in cellulose biosynthesis